jgi:predicted RNase H-like HicB family nuclease
MRNEFTAIIENDGKWFIACCPEIPGANGQGRTKEEARKSLSAAIDLILADRRADGLRGVPSPAIREFATPETRPKYRLNDLLKGCSPENLHGEVDFGPDVGREVIP